MLNFSRICETKELEKTRKDTFCRKNKIKNCIWDHAPLVGKLWKHLELCHAALVAQNDNDQQTKEIKFVDFKKAVYSY